METTTAATVTANPFREGDRVTIFNITSWSAMCFRREVVVTSVLPVPTDGGYDNQTRRFGTFAKRGKRNEFYLEAERDCGIFLRGWDLPVRADTDEDQRRPADANGLCTKIMRGNACFNLVGDGAAIRELIEAAIVPVTDEQRGRCLLIGPGSRDEAPLYPEIDTRHAVMQRIKAELATA